MNMRALKGFASAAVLAASATLGGCITPTAGANGNYTSPIGDAPVTANPTAYTPALNCLADYARSRNLSAPRVAVGRIIDYTGTVNEDGGRRITQGGSLMAMSAFAKSGARLVERFDTSVTELELRYSNNRLIGQDSANANDQVRRIYAGQVPGSDYTFVGGITELNYNIRSVGADAQFGHGNARDGVGQLGGRMYVMNIGLDFRLIDTKTLEVVDVISYQKQIIGREVRAGLFTFFDSTFLDLSAGERALEPVQLAVRAGVERAVVEVMANLYGVGETATCGEALRAAGDPMGPTQASGSFSTGPSAAIAASAARRENTDAWHARRDDAMLRGTTEEAPRAAAPAPAPRAAAAAPSTMGPEASLRGTAPATTAPTAAPAAPAAASTQPVVARGAPTGLRL